MRTNFGSEGRRRRVRRRPEEIAALLEEHRRSGLSQAEFARSRGVSLSSFTFWIRRARGSEPGGRQRLVPVRIVREAPGYEGAGAAPDFELYLPGGRSLRIPARFEPESLRRLIAALESAC